MSEVDKDVFSDIDSVSHGVAKSRTQLSNYHLHQAKFSSHLPPHLSPIVNGFLFCPTIKVLHGAPSLISHFKTLFILAMFGLHCCVRAFSAYSEQRLLSTCGTQTSHCSDFSYCSAWINREQRLQQLWKSCLVVVARRLQSTGLVVGVHGLSFPAACGIFPDQRKNLYPLHWQADS